MEDSKIVATQTTLFDDVGRFALDNALKGIQSSSKPLKILCIKPNLAKKSASVRARAAANHPLPISMC
jgi:hypothetical protein